MFARINWTFAAILSICLILPLLEGCQDWKENVQLHGVTFQKARVQDNGFAIGVIASDTVIGGRPCRAGWVHLHPNGTPAGFTAARDITLPRVMIPSGTWVLQDPNGVITVCAFPRDIEIQGHLCRGSGGPEGVQTAFYPDGSLKQFFTPEPVRIDGVPFAASLFQPGIELYQTGKLRSATLSEDFTLDGQLQPKGERIHLTPDGHADAVKK